MADPVTIAGLGIAGANLLSGAFSGGKQDALAQEALRIEQLREVDRSILRDLMMQRVLGNGGPEASLQYGQATAAGAFRPGGAPGTQNPFERAPTLPSVPMDGRDPVTPEALEQMRAGAADKLGVRYGDVPSGWKDRFTQAQARNPTTTTTPPLPEGGWAEKYKQQVMKQRAVTPSAPPPADQRTPRGTAQWVNRLLGGR